MTVIAVPEVLREKLGPHGAQALVELLNRTSRDTRDEVVTLAVERFERRLAEELRTLETRLTHRMSAHLRWMFGLWVTEIGIILTVLFAFFKT